PPFFALPFIPLAGLPISIALPVWYACNLMLWGSVVGLVIRQIWPLLSEQPAKFQRWCLGLIGLLSLRFLISPLEYHSHDYIVFLCVILAVHDLGRKRSGRAGWWTGLATACKATTLLFLAVFVLQGRWRAVAGFVSAATTATLLPDLLFPRDDGGLWSVAWY